MVLPANSFHPSSVGTHSPPILGHLSDYGSQTFLIGLLLSFPSLWEFYFTLLPQELPRPCRKPITLGFFAARSPLGTSSLSLFPGIDEGLFSLVPFLTPRWPVPASALLPEPVALLPASREPIDEILLFGNPHPVRPLDETS